MVKLKRHEKLATSRRSGFTLVITLTLLVLLTVLCVGLLSLSSVALRTAASGSYEAKARGNARLALMLALGELQKELGPDQRVSARAAILDEDSSSPAADGVANPHWLGAWDSWKSWLNDPEILYTYDKGRSQRFRRWLVSHPDPAAPDDFPLPRTAATTEKAVMVGGFPAGVAGAATDPVTVPMVKTIGNGRYAWWIAGENQKAHVTLTPPDAANNAARLHDRSHWPRGRADWLAGLAKAPTTDVLLDRSITLPTYGLAANDPGFVSALRPRFHDLTVDSSGLAANVRHGGLKRDLNLLLEMTRPPNEYGDYSIANPNGTHASIRPSTGFLPSPVYWQNNNFPSWYKLHQYYQLYRGGGDEVAADCHPLPFYGKGLWGSAAQPNINFNWQRQNFDAYGVARTPIVTRLMLVFSTRRVASTATPGTFDYKLGVNPVVVLWNPYNVTLHSPRQWIQITPGALKYKAYVDGNVKVDWAQLRRSNRAFRLNIYPMEGPAQHTAPIILKPGETRIYSAVTGFISANNFLHSELYPGYQAPDAGGGFEVDLNGLTGLPGSSRVELAMQLDSQRTDHGGQYQIYWTVRNAQTGEDQRYNEMAANPVLDGNPIYLAEDTAGKRILFSNSDQRVPFANFQFVQKSGQDLRNPGVGYDAQDFRSRNFIHSNPVNQRAMYGEATLRMKGLSQYDVHIETGSGNSLNPDFDPATKRSYTGSAISPGEARWPGQPSMVANEFPLVPVTSIASLMHFKLNPGDTKPRPGSSDPYDNYGRHLWEVSANQALGIGNSFAHPLIAGDAIYRDVPDAACRGTEIQMKLIRDFHDHAYLNNDALWDDWFCSGITREDQGIFQTGRNMEKVVRDFWNGDAPTRNPHLIPWRKSADAQPLETRLLTSSLPKAEAHRIAARYLTVEGAFNINSTSVEAWKAFLAGSQDKTIVSIDPQTGNVRSDPAPADRVTLSRFSLPASPKEGKDAGDPAAWLGVRHLTPEQTDRLARECVRQVKERGPFLNLADFINRRLATDETGVRGALQAAIDWDETLGRTPEPSSAESINGRFKGGDDFIGAGKVAAWDLPFAAAATGSRFAGIPGYLTQADLLKRVGNMITPRDDTFRIRGYGESRDKAGAIRARSWCEAIVKRTPDYLEATDMPETAAANLVSAINRSFGRRFEIVSFRWLSPGEI